MNNAGAVSTASALARTQTMPRWVRGLFELALILGLWVLYSLARLLADTNMKPALQRANELLDIEGVPSSALVSTTNLVKPYSLLVVGRMAARTWSRSVMSTKSVSTPNRDATFFRNENVPP